MQLPLILDMARDGFGDRTLIGPRRDGLTAQDLDHVSHRGATLLAELGASAVVYVGVNGPSFPVTLFSAARAGLPLVPLNYRLADEQLTGLIANHPGAFVVADSAQQARLASAGVPATSFADWWRRLRGDAADLSPLTSPPTDAAADGDVAVIIYTSGTTSEPKGVVLRHENLVSYVLGTVEFGGADEDEAAMISVPPYHIAAVANAITNIYAGRRTVVLAQFDADVWLQTVRNERITNALVVPTMLARIVDADPDPSTVATLRTLAYGGASMPVPVISRALALFPHVDFVNAYGLTETSSTIAVLGPEDHRAAVGNTDPVARARLSSAGRVVPTVELDIRDDDGRVLGPGETGRIWVRGPQVSGEYRGSGSVLDPHGFFDTRDQGRLDRDGYLFIAGRADDTIIRGGENIAPAEIEEVLLDHPDVADAVVVGVPDDEWGQRIESAVVLRPHATGTPDALREFVRFRLRSAKTPDRIAVWPDLPRTDTGKLVRREVVAKLAADGAVASPSAQI